MRRPRPWPAALRKCGAHCGFSGSTSPSFGWSYTACFQIIYQKLFIVYSYSYKWNIPIIGIRGECMLSPEERNRLEERYSEEMNSQVKASNDARARRKLAKWLGEDLDDVFLIIEKLPNDQLKKVVSNAAVWHLLALYEKSMEIMKISPLTGEIDKPEDWTTLGKPAKDIDIWWAFLLYRQLDHFRSFYGNRNPITEAQMIYLLNGDEKYRDRVTEEERAGLRRIRSALKNISDKIIDGGGKVPPSVLLFLDEEPDEPK
jgi:hypothetical protein